MPGSMRSVITRSNGSEPESSSRPSLPEKACVQANPLQRKCTATTSLMSASSSMITMDAGSLIGGIVPQGERGNPHFESRKKEKTGSFRSAHKSRTLPFSAFSMAEQRISRGLFHRVRGGGVDGKQETPPPNILARSQEKASRRGGPNRCTHGSDRGAGHRGGRGSAKHRRGRIGVRPIVTTRWNRPSVGSILLHSHSHTDFRILEYRQQRASTSAPPREAAHCGNRALVSPTTPVRSSQPKGNEEAR